MDWLTLGLQLGVPAAMILSLALVLYLDPETTGVLAGLRARLLLGIPFGTITAMLVVLAVYLFVQQGFWHPYSPVTIPFTSWSYLYPLGLLTAPFAHQGVGHLTGNLIGFAAFAPIAEYAVAHFPQERGSHAFGGFLDNPFVRAFVLFPAGVLLVGLVTSVFAWGPIIGFSGVVFAAAGFALVRYPMVTVVALVGREFLGTVYYTVREPIVFGSAGPSFGPPWWAGIAIQGHLLGFLTGVVLAAFIVSRRDTAGPSTFRLWLGTIVAGSSLTLWAIWWYRGASSYVLYRGPGLLMLLAIAVLLASAVRASDTPLIEGISRRDAAIAALAVPVMTMGFVAIPLNLTTIEDATVPGDPIEIDGYQVTYAENVPNQRIGAVNISFLGETTRVNASGVIVVNRDRQIWDEAVSSGQLGHSGRATVRVGGLGWRESVDARREGWQVSGGGTAYIVAMRPPDGNFSTVYESDPVTAAPIIAGRNVSVVPEDGGFFLAVQAAPGNGAGPAEAVREPIPAANQTVEVGGLQFTRNESIIYASRNRTRVPLLQKERYQ